MVTIIFVVGRLVAYSLTFPVLLKVDGIISAAFTTATLTLAGITSTMLVLNILGFE